MDDHGPTVTRRLSQFIAPAAMQGERWLKLTTCVVTWNVAAELPPDAKGLSQLFESPGDLQSPPDLYVVGLQEVVDLNPLNVAIRPHHAAVPWEAAVEGIISRKGAYSKICVLQLVGILLLVYIREDLFPYVSEFHGDRLGVGMGRLGNKGAVGFRFRLFNAVITIVNAHLTAHMENKRKRDRNYQDILNNLCFFDEKFHDSGVLDSDVLIWIGDLNYRLKFPREIFAKVVENVEQKRYSFLASHDQLLESRRNGDAFAELTEAGPISFAPTFKRIKGEIKGFNPKRVPSYTDRIFYKVDTKTSKTVKLFNASDYSSLERTTLSDHKPVRARLTIHILDPHSNDEIPESGTLLIWSILEVAQFFVMLLEVNFRYNPNLYSQLGFNYLLGWSTGILGDTKTFTTRDYLADKPSKAEVQRLTGIERMAWESEINPNYLALEALINFTIALSLVIALFVGIWGLMRLLGRWFNVMRTTQADKRWMWTAYQSITIILVIAQYPCFSLGSFHIALCYDTSQAFATKLILGEAACAGGTLLALLMFLGYIFMMYHLISKVPDKRSYVGLFLHGRTKATWGHFWRLYNFHARYFAVVDVIARMTTGILVGATTLAFMPLVAITCIQVVMLTLSIYWRPYRHLYTGYLMQGIYFVRVCLCTVIFMLEATSEDTFRDSISWILLVSYVSTLGLCLCFFGYHQGRKVLSDLISQIMPCLRGPCTRRLLGIKRRYKKSVATTPLRESKDGVGDILGDNSTRENPRFDYTRLTDAVD